MASLASPIQAYIQEHFFVRNCGGVSSFDDSENCFFIADEHSLTEVSEKIGQLISRVCTEDDTVAVESLPSGEAMSYLFHPHLKSLVKRVKVIGWDSIDMGFRQVAECEKLGQTESLMQDKWKEFKQQIAKLEGESKESSKEKVDLEKKVTQLGKLLTLSMQRRSALLKDYQRLTSLYNKSMTEAEKKAYRIATLDERLTAMINSVEKFKPRFLIAGAAHFAHPEEIEGVHNPVYKKVAIRFEAAFAGKKVLVLTPKCILKSENVYCQPKK